jgi:NADPH:quinone reductase-like Zn-dependent oxidoreductase
LIKICAASVNPVDLGVMAGRLKGAGLSMPLPFTLGYDASGVVEEDGEGAYFALGDEVWGVNWGQGKHDDDGEDLDNAVVGGTFEEYMCLPYSKLNKKPNEISHEQAAAVALTGTTAYQGLKAIGALTGSKKVLVLGGSSALGQLSIQVAKKAYHFVVTTASPRTTSIGASNMIIDYASENWEDMLSNLDALFDCVGERDGFTRAKKEWKTDGAFLSISSFDAGIDHNAHAPLSYAAFMVLWNDTNVQEEFAAMMLSNVVEKTYHFTIEGIVDIMKQIMSSKSIRKHVVKM